MPQKIIAISILFVFSFSSNAHAQSAWFSELTEHRAKKDEEMKSSPQSPIPKDTLSNFKGLNYFTPDNNFNLIAEFVRLKKIKPVLFTTSDGKQKEYHHFADIRFRLNGKIHILRAYYSLYVRSLPGYEKHIFVPFKDLTNLKETYGGGRYLDLTEPEEKELALDFNKAYNPYCAYSDGYSCPKVPKENYLEIRIPAGEKNLYTEE